MSLRLFVGMLLMGSLGAARLAAQDVIVTAPAWVELRNAPDELPVWKKRPQVEFPAELRTTPEIGYVVYSMVLDGKGRTLGRGPHATLATLERVTQNRSTNDAWTLTPGKRDGQGVNTATTFAVIFNPASAAEKNPEATPRLLEVALVRLKEPKDAKPGQVFPDRVVTADVSVDEQGKVTAVKHAPEGLAGALAIAAKNWRFAPARRGGQPMAAELRMPFVLVTNEDDEATATGKRQPPRVTLQKRPTYPFAMRASGMRGEVIVDFIVDIEGRVRNPYVVRSLNPSFDDPAVDAVRAWRFEPGLVGARPVNMHMQVPIVFLLDEKGGGGDGPLTEPRKPDFSKIPAEFHYDTASKPRGTVRVVYPYELLRAKKEGKATVRYIVGKSGVVVQSDIAEASSPEFGRALQAAIECFTFEPALKGGRPTLAIQGFRQDFDRSDSWQLVGSEDLALLRREEKSPASIVALGELDSMPAPLSRQPPRFPQSVAEGVKKGEAVIEFLIDEEGRVRLPRIISATEEAFGYAAVQSVATWRFEPPKRGGRAVVARAQIPIAFTESTAAENTKK